MVDILHKEGERVVAQLAAQHGQEKIAFMRVDVASNTSLEAAFDKCLDLYGSIDIVVNNAGILGETNWETQLEINFFGVIRGTTLAMKYMGKGNYGGRQSTKKGGVVLNIASIHGLLPWPGLPAYSAGKAGVIAYTRCAGHPLEYAEHGVKMLCLCPNAVKTPIHDFVPYIGMTKVGGKFLRNLYRKEDTDAMLSCDEVGEAGVKLVASADTATVWYIHKSGHEPLEVASDATWENLLEHKN